MNPFVVIVIATFRRAPDLARLFASLQTVTTPLAVLVVDNADDPETAAIVLESAGRLEVARLVPGDNLGCGGGLAFGERMALERYADRLTHVWLLDDDTEVAPGALERLLGALIAEKAAIACPMITKADGSLGWFPGLLDAAAFAVVKTVKTPAEYVARCGTMPVRFSWATGVSLLVTREALEQIGFHRTDFWIRGEDLEFTLRVTAQLPGIFVPDAVIVHHSHATPASLESLAAERKKHLAMLQNIAFISLHLPHGRPILRSVPTNMWRYVKTWGAGSLLEALRAGWIGGVRRLPAGATLGVKSSGESGSSR